MRGLSTVALAVATAASATSAEAQFASRAPAPVLDGAVPGLPPTGCGSKDDGSTENALGLTAGGEMGWIKVFDCSLTCVDTISTAYGTLTFPGSVTNGSAGKHCVWSNQNASLDPNDPRWVKQVQIATVVVNGDTDILNVTVFSPTTVPGNESTMFMASADHVAGEFPGPMDQAIANPDAWVVGSTLGPGTLNPDTLTANNVPPLNMNAIGFPSTWLLRIEDLCDLEVGTALYHGVNCPCGNDDANGFGGCANGAPMPANQGAILIGAGSNSIAADDLLLIADNTTNQPGLFFQGDAAINGGNGIAFGDGLRCCGTNVIRLEIADPPGANGPKTTSTTLPIIGTSPPGTITPGVTRCYQWWYRNPNRSLCGANFNLSNAYSVTWSP